MKLITEAAMRRAGTWEVTHLAIRPLTGSGATGALDARLVTAVRLL